MTNSTYENSIQWKTLIHLVAHTTNVNLAISRHALRKSAFLTIDSPKYLCLITLEEYSVYYFEELDF
jgi:hypothetical protein